MKKLVFSLSLALSLVCGANAQSGKIVFENKNHNFGNEIPEKGGVVTHRFMFTNKGNTPVIIQNVTASCGCTTPAWTKEPVAPGEQGFVDATYNPLGRPGAFNKSLTVTNNGEPARIPLTISGSVIGAPKLPEEEFPNLAGNLRLGNNTLNFGRLNHNNKRTSSFGIYNNSNSAVEVSFVNIPKHMKVVVQPSKIEAKQKSTIMVTYNVPADSKFGTINDVVDILQNGKKVENSNFKTTSTVIPVLDNKNSTNNQPVLQHIGGTSVHFGNIKRGSMVPNDFVVKNAGNGNLEILAVTPNSESLKVNFTKKILKPGEEATIKTVLSTKNLPAGQQNISMEIISNYPARPVSTVILQGTIFD